VGNRLRKVIVEFIKENEGIVDDLLHDKEVGFRKHEKRVMEDLVPALAKELGAQDWTIGPRSWWRPDLVEAYIKATGDQEIYLGEWLRSGAPTGVAEEIPACGIFPRVVKHAEASEDMQRMAQELLDRRVQREGRCEGVGQSYWLGLHVEGEVVVGLGRDLSGGGGEQNGLHCQGEGGWLDQADAHHRHAEVGGQRLCQAQREDRSAKTVRRSGSSAGLGRALSGGGGGGGGRVHGVRLLGCLSQHGCYGSGAQTSS